MEHVFITIHDLSLDARIKYVSDSVEDILGYLPHEVRGKSCWEYFHPNEIPFARAVHGRGIRLDKAAMLNYCQIKHKDGSWIGCECVFTVVYDVIVASTSIYRRGPRSRKRALEAPGIRRIFSSSPRDPRYHMLSYISNKFYQEPRPHVHEPRAALFLNRFTRSCTIMFATDGVATILGIRPDQLIGKSFYYCIAENCLSDAVQCLESAKANDSIAYLRFWYRDPMQDDQRARDASMPDILSDEEDNDEGGVLIRTEPTPEPQADSQPLEEASHPRPEMLSASIRPPLEDNNSRSSSGNSTDLGGNATDAIFDPPALERSSSSSMTPLEDHHQISVEVEAVVSCTSDGLVVVLRSAKPMVPSLGTTDAPHFANGLFASPWAIDPVMPENTSVHDVPLAAKPLGAESEPADFMTAIREVAVFAWSLTGINGNVAQYARGEPTGESLPPGGLPIWDPDSNADPENKYNGYSGGSHRPIETARDPAKKEDESTSSEDEVLWMRAAEMPAYRRPKRRAHEDAFGSEAGAKDVEDIEPQSRRRKIAAAHGSINSHVSGTD